MLLRVLAFHLKNENYERSFLYDGDYYLKFYDDEDGDCDDDDYYDYYDDYDDDEILHLS